MEEYVRAELKITQFEEDDVILTSNMEQEEYEVMPLR